MKMKKKKKKKNEWAGGNINDNPSSSWEEFQGWAVSLISVVLLSCFPSI